MTNDPRENKDWQFGFETNASFDSVSGEEFASIEREATVLAKNTCKLLCLTEDGDGAVGFGINKIYDRGFCRPRMWAQYADKHKGVCLIFDREQLRVAIEASVEASSRLFRGSVVYRNRSQAQPLINNHFLLDFDSIRGRGLDNTIREHVSRYWRELFFEKAEDWRDEREFRWVVWDTNHEQHFVGFEKALRGIIVGPDFDESSGPDLHRYREEYDLQVAQLRWKNGVPEVVPRMWPVARKISSLHSILNRLRRRL